MNVFVSHAPRARLADFVQSLIKKTRSIRSTMRSTGLIGAVRWMGPEFFPGSGDSDSEENEIREPDPAGNVYSFAMVCYEVSLSVRYRAVLLLLIL